MTQPLASLRRLLDAHVIGHDDAKRAVLLGLVCREHIYLEGPPGTAKTRMAEIAARGSSLEFFFYQLHRDTRLAELLGDVVLERRPLAEGEGEGERIHQRIEPGGLLTAEVAVLDDISRAPGEALNVLLRILNERKFGDQPIPLVCAIATSNPLRDEYYNEPLDPANLDRFAIQLRIEGLIQSQDPTAARTLIERFADGEVAEQPEPSPVVGRADLDTLYARLAGIELPERVEDALLETLRSLTQEHGCDETNSLLTDRSFLVKSVKLLRGRALLAGRSRVELGDLEVLTWMTTFRVPEEVHEKMPELVARSIARADG
ncbi:MAG: AAA family ATPase [Myxococcota bacterium]